MKRLKKISTPSLLVFAIVLALAPFLDLRVLRMAGDEKVYLSQAIEMARDGRWFAQTLAGEPSYFKGPLHYILIRIGMIFFGDRIVAGTWMNAVFALLAGWVMFRLARKRWPHQADSKQDGTLLLGLATALNVGVFSHAVTSQLEVELCAFYAFALAALGWRDKPNGRTLLAFWLVAGIAGWIKSPVHSVLIGLGGIAYWASTGQLLNLLRSRAFWMASTAGVLAGVAGYLPAFLFDHKNFVDTYLLREQFQKGDNNRSASYVLLPLLHFALPWTIVIVLAIGHAVRLGKRISRETDWMMVRLGLSMALPTILFWSLWSYKGQNYNLPTLPALLLFAWACFKGAPPRAAFKAIGIVGVLALLAALAIFSHFWPLPQWWPKGWIVLAILSMLVFVIAFTNAYTAKEITIGTVAFFVAFGAFIAPLGEREMIDVRKFISEHKDSTYHYYNLDPSIWSEWSLLQLTLHHPVYGLHHQEQLEEATLPEHVVFVQNHENLELVLKAAHHQPISVTTWSRWLTKGKTPDGQSRWRLAWQTRDLNQLERQFYIVQF